MPEQSAASENFSYWRYGEYFMEPNGPIGIITQQLQPSLADNINRKLRERRKHYVTQYPDLEKNVGYLRQDYNIETDLSRFNTGEGWATLKESVRGHDLYIITDVINHGRYINRFNELVSVSPDEHYQDLVRLITATHGVCRRINVIMPYLYEGRRASRTSHESMDAALMLRQLFHLGITNFITFDAHDGRVANAVPRHNFENFSAAGQIIRKVFQSYPDLDPDNLIIVSPNESSISRAIYYATNLHVPLGTFYRVFNANGSTTMNYLGDSVEGKDIWIVDDLLDTSNTIIESASYLKKAGAKCVFASLTFVQFTKGYEKMHQAYDFGIIDKVFATNLSYLSRPLSDMPWFESVDMSAKIATIIDTLNHNASLSKLLSQENQIEQIVQERRVQLKK